MFNDEVEKLEDFPNDIPLMERALTYRNLLLGRDCTDEKSLAYCLELDLELLKNLLSAAKVFDHEFLREITLDTRSLQFESCKELSKLLDAPQRIFLLKKTLREHTEYINDSDDKIGTLLHFYKIGKKENQYKVDEEDLSFSINITGYIDEYDTEEMQKRFKQFIEKIKQF